MQGRRVNKEIQESRKDWMSRPPKLPPNQATGAERAREQKGNRSLTVRDGENRENRRLAAVGLGSGTVTSELRERLAGAGLLSATSSSSSLFSPASLGFRLLSSRVSVADVHRVLATCVDSGSFHFRPQLVHEF